MKRLTIMLAAALFALALAACGGGSAPGYATPGAMAAKAGASNCGGVDEAATYEGAHYVVCSLNGVMVQFVAGQSEGAAKGAAEAMQMFGWMVEQHSAWAVGAKNDATLKAAVTALGA